jgi:hypothetical protein
MPTLIQFISGDSIVVEEDFYQVTSRVPGENPFDQFKRVDKGMEGVRVTVFTASIAYVQEFKEPYSGSVA